MRKFLVVCLILSVVALAYAMVSKNIYYHANQELAGASHRVVVVVNPTTVTGGTILLDENFTLTGTKTDLSVSVSGRVE